MALDIIFYIGLILLMSSTIKGITGFGTALFAMPLLTAFFLTPEEARPLIVTINLMLNVFILLKERKLTLTHMLPLKALIISGFLAALLGGFLLPTMNMHTFNIILGLLLIFTAVNKLFNFNLIITNPKRFFIPMGIMGGLLNTLIGAGGIPVLIFLSNTAIKKDDFRLSILLFFFMLNVGSILSFVMNQAYPVSTLYSVFIYIPVVIVGGLVGMRFQHHINERIFQKFVSILLLFMGINTVFNLF